MPAIILRPNIFYIELPNPIAAIFYISRSLLANIKFIISYNKVKEQHNIEGTKSFIKSLIFGYIF